MKILADDIIKVWEELGKQINDTESQLLDLMNRRKRFSQIYVIVIDKKAETHKTDDNIASILKVINNRIEDLQNNLTSKFEYLKKRVELPKASGNELKTRRFLIDYINNGGVKYRDFAEMALRGC